LRFWETRFTQIKPMKRGGGRRYYRPDDVELLKGIRFLLYSEGYTIKGVQRILKEQGNRFVMAAAGGSFDAGEVARNKGAAAQVPTVAELGKGKEGKPSPGSGLLRKLVKGRTAGKSEDVPADLSPRSDGGLLGKADIKSLNSALTELLECKRLLDQAR
jgi:DNA-binding transcriptional MerR regulator